MILVLGHSGAGKSTLLQRLGTDVPDDRQHPQLLPTTGSELVDVRFAAAKTALTTCREVGGCLSPLWNSYLSAQVRGLLYVIDASDLSQVSFAVSHLVQLLADQRLRHRSVLVVLNKSGLCSESDVQQWLNALRFPDLQQTCALRLTSVVCDAISRHNVTLVTSWIESVCTANK